MVDIFFITLFLFVFEIVYFRLAIHYDIVDRPNHRSLHSEPIIRGGGLVFWVATLIFFIQDFHYPYFFCGLSLLVIVSFIDDIKSLSNKIRILIQFISCLIILIDFQYPFLWFSLFFVILFVGIINAYNFMDGINGITGGYSFINLISLAVLNHYYQFIQFELIYYNICAVLVFLWFNFRKKAICFSGDVGSIGIGFILIFILGKLIISTNNFVYIGFLFVYGIDTVYTIIFRLNNKQDIFQAHKLHFFQILVYEYKWNHRYVASLFAVLQLILNVWIISFSHLNWYFYLPFFLLLILLHLFRSKKGLAIQLKTF